MRQLLLDTHTALWALAAPDDLDDDIRSAIVAPGNRVVVSAVSVWEVEIKRALGKLDAPDGFAAACVDAGFDPLAITFDHAQDAGRLPPIHADPFDRMLIAQARVEQLEIVSDDRAFAAYGVTITPATRPPR